MAVSLLGVLEYQKFGNTDNSHFLHIDEYVINAQKDV